MREQEIHHRVLCSTVSRAFTDLSLGLARRSKAKACATAIPNPPARSARRDRNLSSEVISEGAIKVDFDQGLGIGTPAMALP